MKPSAFSLPHGPQPTLRPPHPTPHPQRHRAPRRSRRLAKESHNAREVGSTFWPSLSLSHWSGGAPFYCTAVYHTTGDARALRVLDRAPEDNGGGGSGGGYQYWCEGGTSGRERQERPTLRLVGGGGGGGGGDGTGGGASVGAGGLGSGSRGTSEAEEAGGAVEESPSTKLERGEGPGALGLVVDEGTRRELQRLQWQRQKAPGSAAMAAAAASALMAVERPWLHRDIVKLVSERGSERGSEGTPGRCVVVALLRLFLCRLPIPPTGGFCDDVDHPQARQGLCQAISTLASLDRLDPAMSLVFVYVAFFLTLSPSPHRSIQPGACELNDAIPTPC